MTINTKGFLHSDQAVNFEYLALIDYIRENYKITGVYPSKDWMTICFSDGDDKRVLSIFGQYTSYHKEGYPIFHNTAKIFRDRNFIVCFHIGCNGNSDKIIHGIIKHFGGGYFIHNDCESEWEIIGGQKEGE